MAAKVEENDTLLTLRSCVGLLVHGPLTALLLLDTFAANGPSGKRVVSFDYRATAPLVVNRRIEFCGRWDAEQTTCDLWVQGEDGTVYMTGKGIVK